MAATDPAQITLLLQRLEGGDRTAVDELLPAIYEDLRGIARGLFRGGGAMTLQPTALVHEAYLRLVRHHGSDWKSRKHFLDVAAMAMRQLLTDHVRARRTERRGGGRERVALEGTPEEATEPEELDLEGLDTALTELEELNPRQARLIQLRYLAGSTLEEAAEVLGMSERTARRDTVMAKAWLQRRIQVLQGEE